MDGHLQISPESGYGIESGDAKYVSGLSTILVATIQEAKDRISQIEYIFCSQLYPNFQTKSRCMQKIYSEARKAAEDEWKEKENGLLLEIKKLQLEKEQALEENRSLKSEMARPSKEQEQISTIFLAKQKSLEKKVGELEHALRLRSKEVDEGMILQNQLLQLVQSKSSVIVDKGKELKEHEKKTNVHLAELECLEKKTDELQEQLRRKIEEVAMGKELQEDLLKKIESQASKIVNNEEQLNDHEKEKKLLTAKLESPEQNIDRLREELKKKTEQVEEGRKLQEQLIQQIDFTNSEMLKHDQQMKDYEEERKLLLSKVKSLEGKVEELQVDLSERSGKVAGGMESYEKLLQCIELKATELASEKNKRRDAIAAYKRLKSQYNFLCLKFGLTAESTPPQHKIDDETESLSHNQNPNILPDHENENPDSSPAACNRITLTNKISCQEQLNNENGGKLAQTSSSRSPIFISPNASKRPAEAKSAPLAGVKRPASHWRETRSHQRQGGPDPHDSFLDTPLENIKGNLNRAMKEEVHHLPVPVPIDMKFDSSDDETQDMNATSCPLKRQVPVPKPVTGGYKFVEPVRKKAERENLKGIECKQCQKFYDAVLPDGGGKDTDGSNKNFRCEHHDGVSRHRYRYVPPLTPEGFWNIGFDSEM